MLKEKFATLKMQQVFADIAKAHNLCLIILYGSVARGKETTMSDVDIGVMGTEPLSHEDEAIIAEKIAHATGIAHIEVRRLHQVSPLFLLQVMNEGIVLFADTRTRAQELRLYAWKLSAETKHMRDARFSKTRERIEAYVR